MRIVLCIVLLFIFSTVSFAQKRAMKISFSAGHALHGTGDMHGYTFFAEVQIPFKKLKRFSVSPGIQFTGHAIEMDATEFKYRAVTSGLTAFATIDYMMLNKKLHRIRFSAGPSLRYQSDSQPDFVDGRRLPTGAWSTTLGYRSPLNTFSAGYLIAPQYEFQITKRLNLGLRLMLQNDTRGDVLTSQSLLMGVRL